MPAAASRPGSRGPDGADAVTGPGAVQRDHLRHVSSLGNVRAGFRGGDRVAPLRDAAPAARMSPSVRLKRNKEAILERQRQIRGRMRLHRSHVIRQRPKWN